MNLDKAVEAAAEAMYNEYESTGPLKHTWAQLLEDVGRGEGYMSVEIRDETLAQADAAVRAVLPFIREQVAAEAWDEGYEAGWRRRLNRNPYRAEVTS